MCVCVCVSVCIYIYIDGGSQESEANVTILCVYLLFYIVSDLIRRRTKIV